MKFRLKTVFEDYLRDCEEIIRAFYPYAELDPNASAALEVNASYDASSGRFSVSVLGLSSAPVRAEIGIAEEGGILFKKLTKRLVKTAMYEYLSKEFGRTLPYGSLTGVRPTKLLYELMSEGKDERALIEEFFVRPDKAALIAETIDGQRGIYRADDGAIDLFVNIPFCPTRCSYCSFISTEYARVKKQIPLYVEILKEEIDTARKIIKERGLFCRAVYVGGGTPTVLEPAYLDEVLSRLEGAAEEFTVEAGRPDTLDGEKLDIMKRRGVTRVSVNPQTFNENTLAAIGRSHTVREIIDAAEEVKKRGFLMNADLIAGLPEETSEDFAKSVDGVLSLEPENVTLHSLALKHGSRLNYEKAEKSVSGIVDEMLSLGHDKLVSGNLKPYYMYRLKNSADNLENTGYAVSGAACVYNIDVMEDTVSVIGAGAGAMSKRVENNGRLITRLCNPKGLNEYLSRKAEIIASKKEFFNGRKD